MSKRAVEERGSDAEILEGERTDEVDLDDPALYLNREFELLSFQERVLEEAADPTNPLNSEIFFVGRTERVQIQRRT